MIRRGLTAAWVGLAIWAAASGAEPVSPDKPAVHWFDGSLEQALAAARQQKKLVLVDAWAKWCGPCHQMDRTVWSREEVARQLEREAVPIKIEVDVKTGVGTAIRIKYGIQALPHLLILDPSTGEALERLEGTLNPRLIFEALDRVHARVFGSQIGAPLPEDPAEAVRLAHQLFRAGQNDAAKRAIDHVLALDQNCRKDQADDAALLLDEWGKTAGKEAAVLPVLESLAQPCASADQGRALVKLLPEIALRLNDLEAAERVMRERCRLFPVDEEAWRLLAGFLFDRRGDPAAAEPAARKSVELDPEETLNLVLLARIRLAQGQAEDALRWIDQAIKIDPSDPNLREIRLLATKKLSR